MQSTMKHNKFTTLSKLKLVLELANKQYEAFLQTENLENRAGEFA